MEPFQDPNKLEVYRRKLGIYKIIANMSGKIGAFVDEDVEIEVLMDMEQQLSPKLFHRVLDNNIIVTLVYAKYNTTERIELRDLLYHLASNMEGPWLVGGDFNIILYEEEKYSGLQVYIREVEDFVGCINMCKLSDLEFNGSLYTWWNRRSDEACIFKRLDRCLGNQQFQDLFPSLEIEHSIKYGSDHAHLLLTYNVNIVLLKISFKFLNFLVKKLAPYLYGLLIQDKIM